MAYPKNERRTVCGIYFKMRQTGRMFNERLRKLRSEKKVSQQIVADYLGITKQAYSLYELGKREPDFETLVKLGEYFGVSTDFILRGEESSRTADDDSIKFALFGTTDIDDEVLNEVRHYAQIARKMREEKQKSD